MKFLFLRENQLHLQKCVAGAAGEKIMWKHLTNYFCFLHPRGLWRNESIPFEVSESTKHIIEPAFSFCSLQRFVKGREQSSRICRSITSVRRVTASDGWCPRDANRRSNQSPMSTRQIERRRRAMREFSAAPLFVVLFIFRIRRLQDQAGAPSKVLFHDSTTITKDAATSLHVVMPRSFWILVSHSFTEDTAEAEVSFNSAVKCYVPVDTCWLHCRENMYISLASLRSLYLGTIFSPIRAD